MTVIGWLSMVTFRRSTTAADEVLCVEIGEQMFIIYKYIKK